MDFFNQPYIIRLIPFSKEMEFLNVYTWSILIFWQLHLLFNVPILLNYFYEGGFFFSQSRLLKLFLLIMPFWLVILYLIQVTEIPRTKRYRVLFFEYLQSTILIIILLLVFYFVFKLYEISRLFLIEFAFLGFLFLFLARITGVQSFQNLQGKRVITM